MTLRDFLRQRLNRGPVSVPIAAHDAWTARALTADRISDGYGQVRTELMAMSVAGEATHYPDLECWTLPAGAKIDHNKAHDADPEVAR
ncbi:MAG: hypothetical protein KGN77_05090 [Xanthomonadaceae bacterium]|nr:hypothetical protein [Xanthomonadaceae bacterium]